MHFPVSNEETEVQGLSDLTKSSPIGINGCLSGTSGYVYSVSEHVPIKKKLYIFEIYQHLSFLTTIDLTMIFLIIAVSFLNDQLSK